MSLLSYFKVSAPSPDKVPSGETDAAYRKFRNRTFAGVCAGYSIYYVCRMVLSVVKQPLIDEGVLTAGQLGIIGSAMLFIYAIGKFSNGFIGDYCNIRRFMAAGLFVSAVINLLMGLCGFMDAGTGVLMFAVFSLLWGLNGWAQSMGVSPGVISLSRWFSLSRRGTFYTIFSSTPYIGKFLTFIFIGLVVSSFGWQGGFIFSAAVGLIGVVAVLLLVSDTPESRGLPSLQEITGEKPQKTDSMPIRELQAMVLKHPGIWVIALSSAFIYITQYAVSGWGVLFLQKAKNFSLENSTQIIAFSEAFGVLGTVCSGWLSDTVFRGDRMRPVIISGLLCLVSLALFLFTGGGVLANIAYVSLFSLAIGMLFCIVTGLMALDIVPRRATGAALGIVGISSYAAAGLQDVLSGFLIQGFTGGESYDFTPVSIFWVSACLISIVLPVIGWNKLRS